jgi:hypothetical protein
MREVASEILKMIIDESNCSPYNAKKTPSGSNFQNSILGLDRFSLRGETKSEYTMGSLLYGS